MSFGFGFGFPSWRTLAGGFSPAALFVGGVQGAWYDPSDPSTLFTTSAGTTQCAMPGQGSAVSVGLMLDKSQGLAGLGTENIVNGNFNDGTTGWSAFAGATISVVSNELNILCPALSGNGAIQNFVTVPGVSYSGSFRLVNLGTFTAIRLRINNVSPASTIAELQYGSTGVFTFRFTAQTTLTQLQYFPVAGTAPGTFIIDDVSVKTLGAGNHAIAFNNTTARPELRARVNLLEYSEQFDNAVWAKDSCTITANATTAPDGTLTADKVVSAAATTQTGVGQSVTTTAAQFTQSWFAKQAEVRFVQLLWNGGASAEYANFDLQTGIVTQTNASVAPTISAAANGFYRITLTSTSASGTVIAYCWAIDSGTTGRAGTYSGNGANGWFVWGADLRPANIGANVPAYQRIADANTYDTSGFPLYLRFDGIDDSMYTPANLNLSGTDKVAVFAGVRKLSDASIGVAMETSINSGNNDGALMLTTSGQVTPGAKYGSTLRGTALIYAETATAYAAPRSDVLALINDIAQSTAATEQIMRINGAQVALTFVGADAGTGNLGNHRLFIGSRNSASTWLNGHLHSLIIAGSAVSAGNISATEQWVANKTGIVIP